MSGKVKVCKVCGNVFPATLEYFRKRPELRYGLASRCKSCAREHDRLVWTTRREKVSRERRSDNPRGTHFFKIISDPDPIGGFPPGALLDTYNLHTALAMGSLTPGSIIFGRKRQYIVVGCIDGKQKLKDKGAINEQQKTS